MQRLKHPNLVRLLDEGIAESGNYYFVSEYLPAGSLTDYTWNNFDGILPVAKACQIYAQALEGSPSCMARGTSTGTSNRKTSSLPKIAVASGLPSWEISVWRRTIWCMVGHLPVLVSGAVLFSSVRRSRFWISNTRPLLQTCMPWGYHFTIP